MLWDFLATSLLLSALHHQGYLDLLINDRKTNKRLLTDFQNGGMRKELRRSVPIRQSKLVKMVKSKFKASGNFPQGIKQAKVHLLWINICQISVRAVSASGTWPAPSFLPLLSCAESPFQGCWARKGSWGSPRHYQLPMSENELSGPPHTRPVHSAGCKEQKTKSEAGRKTTEWRARK